MKAKEIPAISFLLSLSLMNIDRKITANRAGIALSTAAGRYNAATLI